MLIKETKLTSLQDSIVKEVWGHSSAQGSREAVGSMGGILVIWCSKSFLVKD